MSSELSELACLLRHEFVFEVGASFADDVCSVFLGPCSFDHCKWFRVHMFLLVERGPRERRKCDRLDLYVCM